MAFNPFHSFRKHGKWVFAGLVLMAMFSFVLSSGMGRGDLFSQITDAFGGGGGNALVTLNGKKFDEREISTIQNQRRLAGEYMDAAIAAARGQLERRVFQQSEKVGKDDPMFGRLAMQRFQTLQLAQAGIYRLDQALTQLAQVQAFAQRQVGSADDQKKPELAHAYRDLASVVDLDLTLLGRRPGDRFFGPTDKFDDTVNYLVWRQQADKLGIRLSNDDISEMIRMETRDELNAEAAQQVDQVLRQRLRGGVSADAIYAAVGDEYRARMAQLALTGAASGAGRHTLTAVPSALTPQESWDLFKDARTTVKVGMIDVPVNAFVAQVTATPGEDELKKLFEKYKGDEAAPDRAEPGFKEPRKVQVAWVAASPDLPFYQTAADRVLDLAPYLRMLGDTNAISTVLLPVQKDGEVLAQEKAFRTQEAKWWETQFTQGHRLRETSIQRAENVAGMIGATLGSLVPGAATPFTGPLAGQGLAARREADEAARFIAGAVGLAAAPDVVGVFGAPVAGLPQVTLAQLRTHLREKAKVELITGGPAGRFDQSTIPMGLIAADLNAFRGEVMKLGRDKNKEAVEKYVTEFVKQRGLQYGQSKEPVDQYHLGDDPGLAPLKDVYRKGHGEQDILFRRFAPEFFADQSQTAAPDGVFVPHKFVTGFNEAKQFYWWRTDDVPAKTPKYDRVRAEVVEAWKRLQARDLAKKEADRLQDLVKRAQGDQAKLRDLAAQNGGREYFDLGPIAQYMPQINPTAMGEISRDYATIRPGITPEQVAQIYHVTADKVAYPDGEMVQTLLNLREKEKGATAVVTDKPKNNYYVASLLERQEPTQDEFRLAYKGSMARAGSDRDPLLNFLARGKVDDYRKAVLEELKAQAKLVVNDAARRTERSEQ
jgi:hypothetical protein